MSLILRAGLDQFGDLYKHCEPDTALSVFRDKKGWRLLVTMAAVRGFPVPALLAVAELCERAVLFLTLTRPSRFNFGLSARL